MKRLFFISVLVMMTMILHGCVQTQEKILWENAESESVKDSVVMFQTELESKGMICVDVSGAVAEPGVYLLEEGARVYQAVEQAGGLLEDADRDLINQAAVLKDGEKIRIYTVQEAAEQIVLQEQSGMVNLNTADVQQLCTLSGIGESRAQDIIAYREEHGDFKNVEEIMNVSGIKDTTFQKIKDKIVVE